MSFVSNKLFIVRTILRATVQTCTTYTIIIAYFAVLLYTPVLVSTNGNLQTTTVFFTRNFTQGWLNSYYCSLPTFSCLYICASNQSEEDSWSGTFGVTIFRKFYCDYIVVCILCTQCLLQHTCLFLFLSYLLLLAYLEQVRCICCVAFVYCLMLNELHCFDFCNNS